MVSKNRARQKDKFDTSLCQNGGPVTEKMVVKAWRHRLRLTHISSSLTSGTTWLWGLGFSGEMMIVGRHVLSMEARAKVDRD